jgi:membrane protein DedA with SNARE-associated domain
VAPARTPLDLPALAVLLLLGVLHHHGPSVDYVGIGLAAAASWVGVPGPGEPLLIAGGIYAARGQLDLAEVLAVAFAGATAGGVAGWLLGHRGGRAVWTAPGPLQRLRIAALRRGEGFFDRYGVLAVYLTPSWVAGIHGVRAARFLPANTICAAIWTLLIGLGAYLVGPGIEDVVTDLGLGGAVLLLLLLLGGAGLELLRRRRRRGRPVPPARLPAPED